jgi:hypothetical protein
MPSALCFLVIDRLTRACGAAGRETSIRTTR